MTKHIASFDDILAALPAVQESIRAEIAGREAAGQWIGHLEGNTVYAKGASYPLAGVDTEYDLPPITKAAATKLSEPTDAHAADRIERLENLIEELRVDLKLIMTRLNIAPNKAVHSLQARLINANRKLSNAVKHKKIRKKVGGSAILYAERRDSTSKVDFQESRDQSAA